MSDLGLIVGELARTRTVTRTSELTFAGIRPDPQTTVVANVRLVIQYNTDRPTQLRRMPDGDDTQGDVKIWAKPADLAAAYVSDPNIPLGWTGLQTAPPERTDGPPADRVVFDGREYEVTEHKGWEASGTFWSDVAGFVAYEGMERGAAP